MPIGGLIRAAINPTNLAMMALGGPAGFAAIATRTLVSQIGMNTIQQLGQSLGLPQSMIDMAQASFAASAGMPGLARQEVGQAVSGLADQFNLSPMQQGQLQRAAMDDLNNFVSSLSESREMKEARAGGSRGGGGWLMAIAETLGKELDQMAGDLETMAGNLSKDDPSETARFGALSQQFGMMFNATSTAIKAIGEAMSNMARKQ
ncbi:hypothetical protein [Qipengyuania qiaonensis]|uniref:Uncharacterized protein n=1 Tax=Qipengyuania qiaonensis TaxID=2867240 RepID=A0ABS7JCM3_9SPHN|nr:hypothetical protein [Qipengyuania qiaonensis]MBX7482742.1 hypothetical protein [Qipengyuania qiaonensis]